MFPATPGYGNLISGASITAVPYTSYGGQRQSISLEPIFSSPPSYGSYLSRFTAAAKTIVGYKFTYLGHEFKIHPISGYGPAVPGQSITSIMGSPKELPSVLNDRYFIHFKEVVTRVTGHAGEVHNTTLEFTDNTGNKAISWQNPTSYTTGQDRSVIYWLVNPDQKQLPDIIVDDIKRDGKGSVGTGVLERVNAHIAKQDAKIQELQGLLSAATSPPAKSNPISAVSSATTSTAPTSTAAVTSAMTSTAPTSTVPKTSISTCYNILVDNLHVAIANNYYNDVKKLLEKGVNVNCRDHNGISAIEIAQYMKYDDIVKLLVDHGATGGLPDYSSSSSAAAAGGGGSLRKHSRKQSSRKKSRKNCRH